MKKERIRDRMLKRAADTWGLSENEPETSFDPIVGLLINGCASELEKISAEINASEGRVLERLVEVMTPDTVAGAVPARAVMHAQPAAGNPTISLKNLFFCEKSTPNIHDPVNPHIKEIFFGPTGKFKLAGASVRYTALGNTLCKMNNPLKRSVIERSKKHLSPSVLWLGISVYDDITALQDLMFWFNLRNIPQKNNFYYFLKQAEWFFEDKKLAVKTGYNTADTEDLNIESIINDNFGKLTEVYGRVNQYYREQFVTVTDEINCEQTDNLLPQALKEVFSEENLNERPDDKIVWLRLQFPKSLVNDIIDDCLCSLNSFPVINKKLLSTNKKLEPYINIMPLPTEDHYLDIDRIQDADGKNYHLRNYSEKATDEESAIVRSSGIARFDERNASEMVQRLLGYLKDESASFSVIGSDFIKETVSEINQLIAALEQEAEETQFTAGSLHYVVVKPSEQKTDANNFIYVDYWSSCAEQANNLKPGTKLTSLAGIELVENNTFFLTATVGGSSRLSSEEKIHTYREALLTRGRVVTEKDVIAVCYKQFATLIDGAEVKKGVKKHVDPKKGFTRTVDIHIKKSQNTNGRISDTEWLFLCESLMMELRKKSANVYPYRLFVDDTPLFE